MPEHVFDDSGCVVAEFEADMERRTNEAKARAMTSDEHWRNFLSRIRTREAFYAEMEGKLKAVIASGYPLPIGEKDIGELLAIMSLDTLGDPQFWPPK